MDFETDDEVLIKDYESKVKPHTHTMTVEEQCSCATGYFVGRGRSFQGAVMLVLDMEFGDD